MSYKPHFGPPASQSVYSPLPPVPLTDQTAIATQKLSDDIAQRAHLL
ncbi:hypothetical protein [Actinomyces minihominis]|nr:hypothetical protein [Actinomyces minihominis]